MSSKTYTGPPVADMIRDKTLAVNIIKFHNHPSSDCILDDENLNLLQRFVANPSKREQLLKDEGIDPEELLQGRQASLAAFAVWAHGRADIDGGVLKEEDLELLRLWFEMRADGEPLFFEEIGGIQYWIAELLRPDISFGDYNEFCLFMLSKC